MSNPYPGPAFTVIIAVYNGEKTIAGAIQSVLDQTYPAHEIIVIDDGSTDDTAEQVKQFGGAVQYIYQQNAGVAAARNAGVDKARGDWLAFLDADDYYYPHRLKWQAELLQRHSRLDFMTGDFDYVYPDGSLIRRSMDSTEVGRQLLQQAAGSQGIVMTGELLGGFVESHFGDTHTLAMPRQTFIELGGYPVGVKVCEDVNLLIRLCARSQQVGVVCRPMAAYVIHQDGATRSDPLRAQQQTLQALLPLRTSLATAPDIIREGLDGCIRHARLDLAYALIKAGRKFEAVRTMLPLVKERPGLTSLRDVASIIKG
ncbi:MAG TPA: glycosyltransferase family 2 protein [Candidatus Tenderia electrophaga]|uniref:Glycosyltransferase family 2 protein n=1 Tax=Candidatus Tenderia electrophaga TaxID=1748243 RepID=A0A832J5X6_9GAMM|nr:glycosyltransferase family 2 protein [Candidatus Tenderia electrophaga]